MVKRTTRISLLPRVSSVHLGTWGGKRRAQGLETLQRLYKLRLGTGKKKDRGTHKNNIGRLARRQKNVQNTRRARLRSGVYGVLMSQSNGKKKKKRRGTADRFSWRRTVCGNRKKQKDKAEEMTSKDIGWWDCVRGMKGKTEMGGKKKKVLSREIC